ncbi:MAG: YbfB/YjiJ family MFS transporter [Ramlibacter sp.]
MTTPATSTPPPLAVAVAGLVALAVAMGIGRFAFTPLLPLMLAEQSLDLGGASLLASANYFGYLLGALACTFQPWLWRRIGWTGTANGPALVRGGLVATVLLTFGMALHLPAAWVVLRFAAGVASAVVFLYVSVWCLEQLARAQRPAMGALIYTGPGAGIVASGLAASALVTLHAPASAGWLTFGVLAAALTAWIWPTLRPVAATSAAGGAAGAPATPDEARPVLELALLSLAYGLAGLGYIVTATFLPVIARAALPGSHWLDLFWPLLGCGVIVGALLASRIRGAGDHRRRLAACYVIQALGVAASLVSPTLAGFAVGSVLLGLPFTTITFFAMQEVRRLKPRQPTPLMGLLTAMYGVGQIAGPPLAAWLVARSGSAARGFDVALWVATGALVLGALLYSALARLYPARAG